MGFCIPKRRLTEPIPRRTAVAKRVEKAGDDRLLAVLLLLPPVSSLGAFVKTLASAPLV
jgi:hypothetical protein